MLAIPAEFLVSNSHMLVVNINDFIDILFQVRDTGCGISPQDLPHIFTKFVHTQNGASKGSSGSGLGLAICKRYF